MQIGIYMYFVLKGVLFHCFVSNHSMWGLGSREQPLIAIVRKDPSQAENMQAVDVFDCKDYTGIKTVELGKC